MTAQIVLLNGPSGSGKTSGGRAVAKWFGKRCLAFGFADDLKRATHAALGMWDIPFDKYEDVKNIPNDDFFGISPRKAYIAHSEIYMKQIYGNSIFSRLARRKIDAFAEKYTADKPLIVMTDCGFTIEADSMCRYFGPDNVLVIRLHRRGYTFDGDSREYVINPLCSSVDVHNDGSFEAFVDTLTTQISLYLLGQRNANASTL